MRRGRSSCNGPTEPQSQHTEREASLTDLERLAGENQRLHAENERLRNQRDDLLRQCQSQQAYFEAVLEQLPAGVVIVEAPSGRVLLRNQQVEAIFRRQFDDADNVLPPHGLPGYHSDGRRYQMDEWPLIRAILKGETVSSERIGIERPDGTCGVLSISSSPVRDAEGRIVAAVAVDHDVTDLYMAREELKQVHERLRSVFDGIQGEWERLLTEQARQREFLQNLIDNSPIGIVVVQGSELRFVLANPAAHAFWPNRTLLGRTLAEALPEVVANFTSEQLQAVLRTGQPDSFREYPIPHAGGREQTWWNIDRIPLRNEQGQYDLVLVMIQDVTDYVLARQQVERAAAHLKELNETLERRVAERTAVAEQRATQLQRLAGELTRVEERERRHLAEILHDHLQQLLVGAKFGTSMAKARVSDPRATETLRQVDDLLDQSIQASRSLTTELSPPILYQADLTGVLFWLARWVREKHGLRVRVEADPAINPQAEETRIVLFQAVRELLLNVAKHSRVKWADVQLTRGDDDSVQVSVRDQGVGFDPTQVGRDQTGSGFGLFNIHERLILLGGRMEIRSAPGAGTEVALWAPLRQVPLAEEVDQLPTPAPDARDRAAVRRPADRATRLRVMLADDHDVVRDGLLRLR